MPLVQIPSARRCRYVREVFPIVVVKEHFGRQRAILRPSGGQINVQIAIIVNITKIGAHWHIDFVQADFCSHIFESTIAQIAV